MKIIVAIFISCIALACLPAKIMAQVDAGDSLALVGLYNSTNGPGWKNTDSVWLSGPVTGWYGVSVQNGRVDSIILSGNNLSGSLPAAIGDHLANLSYLDLSGNSLTGGIPAGIGNLHSLFFLSLSTNNLGGAIPAEIGQLHNLGYLYLNGIGLTGSIPSEFGDLSSLVVVEMYSNGLSGNIPPSLGNLTNLHQLNLENNNLSGNIPVELGNLTQLTTLFLDLNQLSGSIPAELGNLTRLADLDVKSNGLSGAIPATLGNFTELSYLHLENNRFTFAGMEAIAKNYSFAVYSPQANIAIAQTGSKLSVNPGGTLAKNTYKWYRNNILDTTITDNDTFEITLNGTYKVLVDNTTAGKLTLSSSPLDAKTLNAAFTASDTAGFIPLTIQFTDHSTSGAPINNFSWDFGDGKHSSAENPSHTYTTAGTYTVSLHIQSSPGNTTNTDSLVLINYIIVHPRPGIITTAGGNGTAGYSGDGGLASKAQLSHPGGVTVDCRGNLYIADVQNNVIRTITNPAGTITSPAGNGSPGNKGDKGKATTSQLFNPGGVTADCGGNVYIADTKNDAIRKVDTSGIINTIAGIGEDGYSGDNGPATGAALNDPIGIVSDADGNIYFADTYNNAVRKISTAGIITTVAGNGKAGYSGDGGNANKARLNQPYGLALDGKGSLYIADTRNNVIRRVDKQGIITTIAGTGKEGFSGDNGNALAARLNKPMGVVADTAGNIYIADTYNNRIREVNKDSLIFTIAGGDTSGYKGDSSKSPGALLNSPEGLAIDTAGNLYIADAGNNVIRKISPDTSKLVLPLTLLDFNAALYNNAVKCTWLTASEIGVSRFVVERSGDGLRFAALDSIAARNAGSVNSYTYNDENAVKLYAGALFYRLRMVDKDGTANYSEVRRVVFGQAPPKMLVYPNPVHGNSFILHIGTDTKLPAEYKVTDIAGRVVQRGVVTSKNQNITLPGGAANGMYVLTLTNGNSILLMKQ